MKSGSMSLNDGGVAVGQACSPSPSLSCLFIVKPLDGERGSLETLYNSVDKRKGKEKQKKQNRQPTAFARSSLVGRAWGRAGAGLSGLSQSL